MAVVETTTALGIGGSKVGMFPTASGFSLSLLAIIATCVSKVLSLSFTIFSASSSPHPPLAEGGNGRRGVGGPYGHQPQFHFTFQR